MDDVTREEIKALIREVLAEGSFFVTGERVGKSIPLRPFPPRPVLEGKAQSSATEWLVTYLTENGATPYATLAEVAKREIGVSPSTLKRSRLNINARHSGTSVVSTRDFAGPAIWRLENDGQLDQG